MELSWLMKLRITAAMAVGVVLIGILAWPLAAPTDPLGAVLAGNLSFLGVIALAILAAAAGLIGYFVSWPYGRQIGILAVPAGLALWAIRTGNMAGLIQQNPEPQQRQELFAAIRWEPVFWLAIIAAGLGGVLLGQLISTQKAGLTGLSISSRKKPGVYLNTAIALVASIFVAHFCVRVLARDVKISTVVAQPAIGQIVFAVFVSFGIAGFVVKKFLDAGHIWPTIATAFLTAFASLSYVKQDVLQPLAQNFPPTFFPYAAAAILPVQMVAFGTLGSICGYWAAVRFNYWRKHKA